MFTAEEFELLELGLFALKELSQADLLIETKEGKYRDRVLVELVQTEALIAKLKSMG